MKTKYFFYTLLCVMSVGKIKAADLYVRDLGAGGAYSTISAAISAANDGDRIIIRPKTGNVPYLESLSINKSLTFVSETNFTKYYIQGSIIIVPAANRVITINNMYSFQSSIATTSTTITGGRCTINILNSVADIIDLDNTKNVSTNIYGSTFNSLSFLHGKVTGNTYTSIYLGDDIAPFADSSVYIIANKGGSTESATKSYPVNIMNNDLGVNGSNLPALLISDIKPASTNVVQNNKLLSSNTPFKITASLSGNIAITNNILDSNYSGNLKIDVSTLPPTVIATYNISSTSFSTSGVDIQDNNTAYGSYTLNLNNLTSSGAIINAGIPDEEYQDLDLTRSDIGPLGGSNSWTNYWQSNAGNKPRVMFLNTPRRVYQGTGSIQAEATGISK
ncbi:hypothetical protein KB553_12810 [Chryseobacterium rhizoplanae]|uniref:hypothetical protein n=1 Tax=Chryseobacterium rhizoplanae TaxID=1609531 RepID=UPI001CE30C74|nr:hypothetical protein [Chryseobacterium rhizoplanae]UCA57936.1 hypothetical protein KB553_12810 [Chryseobacterium rhizoplanae]